MNKGLKIFLGVLSLLLVAGAVVTGILFFRWKGDRDDAKKEYESGKESFEKMAPAEEHIMLDASLRNTEEQTEAPATEAVTEAATEAATEAVQLQGDAAKFSANFTDKKISIYSWNTELGDRLKYFYEKYPEYQNMINYVNLGLGGTSDDYKMAIQSAIDAGGDAYPSIICTDNDVAHYFMDSDNCLTMDQIGITSDMTKNCYSYTLDFATVNGSLKALSWQACPGSFIYRNDIADAVFGTHDPADIQNHLQDWDSFMASADQLKEAGFKIVSGPDDIKYVFLDQRNSPWVSDDKLNIDVSVTNYLEMAKMLYDGGYTNRTSMWSDAWNAGFSEDVFGYFGCTWFVYWCIPQGSKFDGNCSICQGPKPYHWGGSYLTVTKGCPNQGLAALVIYTLCCDTDVMQKLSVETLDFVNNQQAIANLISSGQGASEVLAGYNPLTVWDSAAKGLSLKNATEYDSTINGFLDTASMAYNSGEYSSIDEAVAGIKNDVQMVYPFIDVN